jgi:hypothetical protein
MSPGEVTRARDLTFPVCPGQLFELRPIEGEGRHDDPGRRRRALDRRITRATGTEAIAPYIGEAGALRAAWKDLPLTRQRAIVAAVLDRAYVGRGLRGRTRFDPDRIEPLWRV